MKHFTDPKNMDVIESLFYNHTKATNLDATIAALKRYQEHYIYLILGGDGKGVDLQKNEVALLSPAASILDEFRSYVLRSNEFKERVKTLNIKSAKFHKSYSKCQGFLTKKYTRISSPYG